MTVRVIVADVRAGLARLADESVHCVVTSPPYYGLRDYGIEPQVWGGEAGCEHEWQIDRIIAARTFQKIDRGFCRRCSAWRGSLGLEPTPALYIEHMVAVFREVRRVLRKDGTLWLNIGDSYAATTKGSGGHNPKQDSNRGSWMDDRSWHIPSGLKPKDLLGIPWMLAFALRDDGWYLRSEITWAKRAPMPESVTDRPTSATEKVFLFAKSAQYFYDADAVREELTDWSKQALEKGDQWQRKFTTKDASREAGDTGTRAGANYGSKINPAGRNMRNWWLLGPEPFPEAHFATFPTEIPRRAILAGTSERGVCPKCGGPWERVIKRKSSTPERENWAGQDANPNGHNNRAGGFYDQTSETIGWRPTCSCNAGDPVPATVLDPFLGAGTTALVADRLGRHAIGIELNPEYAAMAERRVRGDAPLFADITTEGELPADWQEQDALGSWRVAVDAMHDRRK